MANRRTERKTPRKSTSTRSTRTEKRPVVEETPVSNGSSKSILDYFRVSESYTSLILGVVVVIITSLLLIAFLRNRTDVAAPQSTKDISTALKVGPTISLANSISDTPNNNVAQVVSTPTVTPAVTLRPTVAPTTTIAPTARPTVAPSAKPTLVPTVKPTAVPTKAVAKATVTPTPVAAKPTVAPTVQPGQEGQKILATTYITKSGDSLWVIAERYYRSGYNWVDIAKANNITNPDVIIAGVNLKIPGVERKVATITASPTPTAMANMNKPSQPQAKTYTVKAGEDLWDISVKVYGNGYRWTEIAKLNNLTNPSVIHSGNVLKLP